MATREQMQAWLFEAEEARHKLMTGQREVSISYYGRAVSYDAMRKADLDAYIADLKAKLDGGRSRARRVNF